MHTLLNVIRAAIRLRSASSFLIFFSAAILVSPASAQNETGPWADCARFSNADERQQCSANNKAYPAVQQSCMRKGKGGATHPEPACVEAKLPFPMLRVPVADRCGPMPPQKLDPDKVWFSDCERLGTEANRQQCNANNKAYPAASLGCAQHWAKGCVINQDQECARAKLPYPNLNISASMSTDAGILHDCRNLADAGLKRGCIEINAAYPRIAEECRASHNGKGINGCINAKLPKAPSYFTFDLSQYADCRNQLTPPKCTPNTGLSAILPGQQQVCTEAQTRSLWCIDNDKMIQACPAVGDPFYQADCLIKYRARKK